MSLAGQTAESVGIAFDRTGPVLTLGSPASSLQATPAAAATSAAPTPQEASPQQLPDPEATATVGSDPRGPALVLGVPGRPSGTASASPLVLGVPGMPGGSPPDTEVTEAPKQGSSPSKQTEDASEEHPSEEHQEDGQPDEESTGPPPEEGAPAWVMTFGDLMSLLLTFFILLFSMSSIEEEMFRQMSGSMVEAFGGEGNPITTPADDPVGGPPPPVPLPIGNIADEMLQELAYRFRSYAATLDDDLEIAVAVMDDGLYVRIPNAGVFEPGSASLEPAARSAIAGLAGVVTDFGFPAIVSGHTDDVPITSTFFPSNWELSGARAAGVARLLFDSGVSTDLVLVRAYGEFQPVATNDTAEGRAMNRRVEFFYSRADLMEGLARDAAEEAGEKEPAEAALVPAVEATREVAPDPAEPS